METFILTLLLWLPLVAVTSSEAPATATSHAAAPATCVGYVCPQGLTLRNAPENMVCLHITGCSAVDKGTCCREATVAPLPAPTPAPMPVPEVLGSPEGCKVTMPPNAFEPWEVYKVMKTSTRKIRTPPKAVMGGQTLQINYLNDIKASAFHCLKVDSEWRAIVNSAGYGGIATISLHDSTNPAKSTTHCHLGAISLYMSEAGVPGLRFDYADCAFGPGKKATVLMGLKKVPDTWAGHTPGISAFFQDVCSNEQTENPHDARLTFPKYSTMSPEGLPLLDVAKKCFAHSASLQIMQSDNNCFETAMVFTLLDENNHFPLFAVTDSEWAWLISKIPRATHPLAAASTAMGGAVPKNPFDAWLPDKGVEVYPKVYGHVIADRVCIDLPELGCDNDCGKSCDVAPQALAKRRLSTDIEASVTSAPSCSTCYDCGWDEVCYATIATLLAFNVVKLVYGSSSSTVLGFGLMSFFSTVASYYLVNMANYVIAVVLMKKEMCIKIFGFQTNLVGTQGWQDAVHWSWSHGSSRFSCHNDVCPFRLTSLILSSWLSLWALFAYQRHTGAKVLAEEVQSSKYEEMSRGA